MADTAIAQTPATDWGALFGTVLGKVVDTASLVAVKKVDDQQTETLANQATETAKANAAAAASAAASANAKTTAATSSNWQKIALYAGLGVVAIIAVVLVVKKRK